jgi:hypothetical protein
MMDGVNYCEPTRAAHLFFCFFLLLKLESQEKGSGGYDETLTIK